MNWGHKCSVLKSLGPKILNQKIFWGKKCWVPIWYYQRVNNEKLRLIGVGDNCLVFFRNIYLGKFYSNMNGNMIFLMRLNDMTAQIAEPISNFKLMYQGALRRGMMDH